MNKATFLQRFIAWIVDQLIIVIISYLLLGLVILVLRVIGSTTDGLPEPFAFLFSQSLIIFILLLPFFYFGYFWQKGQSIGMGLMNIQVIKTDGSKLSFLIAGLRGTFGYWISGLISGLGYLWALFDPQKQAWHDKIFSTSVVQR